MTTTENPVSTTNATAKYVYLFGDGKADGSADMRNLLGGKGAGLAEMTNLGVPVPPGFTITTEVCTAFYELGRSYPKDLDQQVRDGVTFVEKLLDRRFGDPERPLLVSVRSGARVSMPGMMDTVLNLGLNDAVAAGLARETGDERFAYDSYRRFVSMYGDVVLGIKGEGKEVDPFERILEAKKESLGVELDTELPASALKELVVEFKFEILEDKANQVPGRPLGPALGRRQRRVRLLGEPARRSLPPHVRDPRQLGHCRQRAGHGLRQPR